MANVLVFAETRGNSLRKVALEAITAARAVVFGLLALAVGALSLFLFLIGLVRLINVYLPGKVWATYLLLGTVFTLGGIVLFSMRKPRPQVCHLSIERWPTPTLPSISPQRSEPGAAARSA